MVNIKTLIPIIVVLGLVAVFGFLYEPKPKAPLTIESAISNLSKTESFKVDGDISLEIKSKDIILPEAETEPQAQMIAQTITTSLSFTELLDQKDKDKQKAAVELNLTLGAEGLEFQVGGEIKLIENDIYLRITSLPALPLLGEGFEELKNQWFKIEGEKFVQEGQEIETKKLIRDLKEITSGKNFFEVKEDLGDNHYLTELKKETFKELIPQFLELAKEYVPEEDLAEYEKNLEEFLKRFPEDFDDAWQKLEPLEFDLWLGDEYLKRIKFEKEINLADFAPEQEGSVKISVDLNFSEFGKKFNIEAPKEFRPIEEILPPSLFGEPLPGSEPSPGQELEEEPFFDFDLPEYEYFPE